MPTRKDQRPPDTRYFQHREVKQSNCESRLGCDNKENDHVLSKLARSTRADRRAINHDRHRFRIRCHQVPRLVGQWRRPAGVGTQWTRPSVPGSRSRQPLVPEYQARLEASIADQARGGQGDDVRVSCVTAGMPRIMTGTRPFELVALPAVTYVYGEGNMPRRIYTDGRDFPNEEPSLMGYSIGKWVDENGDGKYDALEVETRNFKGPRTYENSGILLHADHQSVIKERFYLDKTNPTCCASNHDDRSCADQALDGGQDLPPRAQVRVGGIRLRGEQQPRPGRQGILLLSADGLPDANPQGPAAARPALFHGASLAARSRKAGEPRPKAAGRTRRVSVTAHSFAPQRVGVSRLASTRASPPLLVHLTNGGHSGGRGERPWCVTT